MQIENVREKHESLLTDVESLRERPIPEVREIIAEKVAIYFNKGLLDSSENNIARDIIRMLARDVEPRVRRTLSYNLRHSIILPHDIALRLANDILEISAPILECSTVLTDEDLVNIIRNATEIPKLAVLSRRKYLSEIVSAELIKLADDELTAHLLSNETAKISQRSLEFAFNSFKDNSKVIGALINRNNISSSVVEQILNSVSAEVRSACTNKTALGITSPAKGGIQQKAKDISTTPLNNNPDQPEYVVNRLFRDGRLRESLILRSLCEGNVLFFEAGIAKRAGMPIMNVRMVIQKGNFAARRSLWRRAKMPESIFEAMDVLINFATSTFENQIANRTYSQQLLEYIQEKGYERTVSLMPYVMALVASKVRVKDTI